MPVRAREVNKKFEYTYEDLLYRLLEYIETNYKNISEFLDSEEYLEAGFENTSAERSKMFTYLSKPAKGEKANVKSIPVLKKFYTHIFDIDIENKIKVVRTQILHTNKKI